MSYPAGYLSYGGLPSFTRERPCRFCGVAVEAPNPAGAICQGEECRKQYSAGLKLREARYQRRQYRKRKAAL